MRSETRIRGVRGLSSIKADPSCQLAYAARGQSVLSLGRFTYAHGLEATDRSAQKTLVQQSLPRCEEAPAVTPSDSESRPQVAMGRPSIVRAELSPKGKWLKPFMRLTLKQYYTPSNKDMLLCGHTGAATLGTVHSKTKLESTRAQKKRARILVR